MAGNGENSLGEGSLEVHQREFKDLSTRSEMLTDHRELDEVGSVLGCGCWLGAGFAINGLVERTWTMINTYGVSMGLNDEGP